MHEKKAHPIFPNPTVVEAIVEVYLGSPLADVTLNAIFDDLKANYQEFHRDQLVSYQAMVGERGMSISQDKLPGQLRLQFKNQHNNFLIQIFPNRISVHRIPSYDGWNSLITDFLKTWEKLDTIAHNISIQRIGVRFINKLNEKTIDDALKKWLKPSPYYPEIILSSHTGFFFRGQWLSNQGTANSRTHIVSIAEGGTDDEHIRPLMFDIDIVQNCHAEDKNVILDLASELHEEIWNIFRDSISDNYLKILNKKQ